MLKLTIPASEFFNELTQEFVETKEQELQLEHSLVSLSKWESKWCKPFLIPKQIKTDEEVIDYIRCMNLTQNTNPDIFKLITPDIYRQIVDYIDAPMTATTFAKNEKKMINREIITSELIYYWMVALNIPFECQKWHLNRLLTLVNVCNIKNQPNKKMSQRELMDRNKALNEARKTQLNTGG